MRHAYRQVMTPLGDRDIAQHRPDADGQDRDEPVPGPWGVVTDRKTPFRLLLSLAILACVVLGLFTATGRGPFVKHISPSAGWVSPSRYVAQPDNPLPVRNRTPLHPTPYDAVTSTKQLFGTQNANVVVRQNRVDELVGGSTVWSGAYASIIGFTGRLTLPDVEALVAHSPHPDWLRHLGGGIYLLSVGMVQAPGTRLEVSGPDVRELRLAVQPNVFISGVGASALFQDVKISSWIPASGGPDRNPADRRPFISYDNGGRLDVINCEFSYLGTDASQAYGVSWGTRTTGSAVASVFDHNLFGAYTARAVGVVFKNNVFRDNADYGLDPHTNSSGLTIVGNEAYGNNTHGIMLSQDVNHSVIESNRSHDNGANGIMLDDKSDFNIIRNNQSWNNRGDGIVVQGSSHAVVADNTVSGNLVGVRVNANRLGPADDTRVADNQISGNRFGIRVYGGSRDTVTEGNQIINTADQALHFVDPATSQSDTVSGASKAVVVEHAATIAGLSTANVGHGLLVHAGARVMVKSSQLTGRDLAVKVLPEGELTLLGSDAGAPSTVSGARKGVVVVGGSAVLRNVAIHDVDRGVLVDSGGRATIATSRIVTDGKGVEVQDFNGQSRVQLISSIVRARQPLFGAATTLQRSGNKLTSIPSWLAVAGALFVLLAALLHLGHRIFVPESHPHYKTRRVPLPTPRSRPDSMVEKVVGTMKRVVVVVGPALVAIAGLGIAAVKLTGAAPVLQQSQPLPTQAAVATLVDGQTFEVRSNDQLTRIRLLDIVTPPAAGSEGPAQCLGPEASAFLASTIPVGTKLKLAYETDQFDQSIAAVSTDDGRMINAEIARAGFAEPVANNSDDGNPPGGYDQTLATVQTAARDAVTNKRGVHSPDIGCTVPGQVKTVLDMVAKIPTTAPAGARGIDLNNLANMATDARAAAEELARSFTQNRQDLIWTVLDASERSQLQHLATQGRDQVAAAEVTLRAAATSTLNNEPTQRQK